MDGVVSMKMLVVTPILLVVLPPMMVVVVGTTGPDGVVDGNGPVVDLDGISGVVTGSGVVIVILYGAQKQHDPGTSMNRCPLSSQSS